MLQHPSRDTCTESAARNGMDRRDELVGYRTLECVAVRPGAERGQDILVVGPRQDEDAYAESGGTQLITDPEPVTIGHGDIEYGHIRPVCCRCAHRLTSVLVANCDVTIQSPAKSLSKSERNCLWPRSPRVWVI